MDLPVPGSPVMSANPQSASANSTPTESVDGWGGEQRFLRDIRAERVKFETVDSL
jgi:hypothetical protein